MASATITGDLGAAEFDDGTDMNFEAAGEWLTSFRIGPVIYEIDPVYDEGVDGGGTKNYGFRSQTITLEVEYVEGNEHDCIQNAQGDANVIGASECTLVLAGITYPACIEGSLSSHGNPKHTGVSNQYRMTATITLKCVRNE